MILVDTSVWVDHLRHGNRKLASCLDRTEVWCHPVVIGELACGNLARRDEFLTLLASLPQAPRARHGEALAFLESHRLMGRGIGWIDLHLLASARLARLSLWTLDSRLATAAGALGIRAEPILEG